ncbi:MAG: alpha/beta fold hydrolase [Haloarculaceae archaeon]
MADEQRSSGEANESRGGDRDSHPDRDRDATVGEDAAGSAPDDYATVALSDGRELAYATYGNPGDDPVLFCHGNPGSRLSGALVDAAASWLDVRLIVPDRPGRGYSTPLADHALLEWPEDAVALFDALDVERAGVVGFSAGGAFALATAHAYPDRVRAVSLVSALAPPSMVEGLGSRSQLIFAALSRAPWLARGPYRAAAYFARNDPERLLDFLATNFSPADEAVFEDPDTADAVVADVREAFRQGTRWPAYETGLVAREWGFDPTDVTVPVSVWHGRDDRSVPPAVARAVAEAIPATSLDLLDAEGHYSTLVNHPRPILYAALEPG